MDKQGPRLPWVPPHAPFFPHCAVLSPPTVAVSGINGYLGSHVTSRLLRAGYTVHGTVRKNSPSTIDHLTSLDAPGRLRVFQGDLNVPGSFDDAVEGCKYALHIASPFCMDVENVETELIKPSVNGTLSFLRSCKKAGVQKVVLTSSLAALADSGSNGKIIDENTWNEHSSLHRMPHYYSKTIAEKTAWRFVEQEGEDMRLVVINPGIMLGPSMTARLNPSFDLLVATVKGQFLGIVDLQFAMVDVRDVAEAHVRAMEMDMASGRYICTADRLMAHKEITQLAVETGFRPPLRDLAGGMSTRFIKSFSHVMPGGSAGQYTRRHLGNPVIVSNKKIKQQLGMVFRSVDVTIKDGFEDLVKWGHVQKPDTA